MIAEAAAAGCTNLVIDADPAFVSLETVLVAPVPGEVVVAFTAGPGTVQGHGVVGGGTLANMLDCALATAVLSTLPPRQSCSTVSLTVHMMRSAPLGRLTARATVEKAGRRIVFARAVLMDATGQTLATGTSSLAIVAIYQAVTSSGSLQRDANLALAPV